MSEHEDRLTLVCKTFITLLCVLCAVLLFWYKRDGGNAVLLLISGSPLADRASRRVAAAIGAGAQVQAAASEEQSEEQK